MVLWIYKWYQPDGRLTEAEIADGMVDLLFTGLVNPAAASGSGAPPLRMVPPPASGTGSEGA
jgi:hypothetical protein